MDAMRPANGGELHTIMLQTMSDMAFIIDSANRVTFTNTAFTQQTGLDAHESPGLTLLDILPPASIDLLTQMREQLHQGKTLHNNTFSIRTRYGHLLNVDGSLIPHNADGNEATQIIGLFKPRVNAEQQLKQYAVLLQNISDAVIFTDINLRIISWNQVAHRIYGWSAAEATGNILMELIPTKHIGYTPQNIRKTLERKGHWRGETIQAHKDGTPIHVLSSISTIKDHEGYIAGFITINRDITERQRVEDQLRYQANLLQNVSDAIIAVDNNGLILTWNKAAEALYGWSRSEVIGRTLEQVFEKIIISDNAEVIQQMLKDMGKWHGEARLNGHDGQLLTVLAAVSTVHNRDGKPNHIVIVTHDITHRKQIEEALRRTHDEQEQRVEERTLELQAVNMRMQAEIKARNRINVELRLRNQAIESSNSAITIADATQPDMPLVYVNPAFERITGYSEAEILGKNCRFLQGQDRDQPGIALIRQAIKANESCVVTLRNYRKDGTLFWNELRITPMKDQEGMTTHFVGISTDITDRKNDEQRIRAQNEALLRANRALAEARLQAEAATRLKTEFLATMSHELRTPLNAVIGYTEIQLAGMTGPLNEEQRDYQERVLVNAEHLLSLINDVLDISKIEAGRVELVHKAFDLHELLREIVDQTEGLAQKKSLNFIQKLDPRLPNVIMGDPERLRQIAINLLSNAIKFTHEGQVSIELRPHGPDTWILVVNDTGVGIPAHMQETIFEEFRQVDGTSQRAYGGTGLGLAIVRRLALMMGGTVRVNSTLDEGSTFTVFLPLRTKESQLMVELPLKEGQYDASKQHQ